MTDVPTSRRPDSPASSTDLAYPERKALRESRMMQNTLDHSSNPQSVETFSRARASSNPERASRRPASRAQGRSKLAHVDVSLGFKCGPTFGR